jgi:hypothetical protein
MMVLSSRRPDASLIEYVESRARSAPLRILIAHTVLALAVALTAYLGMLCSFFVGLAVLSGIALLFALSFTLLGSPWIL